MDDLLPARSERARSEEFVDLYWLPLGAGGHSVRVNGKVFEALVAAKERRPRLELYHAALLVGVPEGVAAIEMGPASRSDDTRPRAAATGAVGTRWAGRIRLFRYEVRCTYGGTIPDIAEAVDSPRRLSEDAGRARRLLELVPQVPTPVWGRDGSGAGEMWNSNSLVSWLLVRSGHDVAAIEPPAGGRAPGWNAGLVIARWQRAVGESGSG
jgi:hypothetical protein